MISHSSKCVQQSCPENGHHTLPKCTAELPSASIKEIMEEYERYNGVHEDDDEHQQEHGNQLFGCKVRWIKFKSMLPVKYNHEWFHLPLCLTADSTTDMTSVPRKMYKRQKQYQ